MMVDPKWRATEADKLTSEMVDFLAELIPQFRAEGFEVVANRSMAGSVPGADLTSLLLVNRKSLETAAMTMVQATLHRNAVFSFASRFADGTQIRTGINREIGCFPKDPKIDSLTIGWTITVGELYELHRRRVRHLGRDRDRRIVPAPGSEMAYLTDQWNDEASHLVNVGYCYLDAVAGAYRRTLKGSFLTLWRLTPSVKRWRIRFRNRQSRKMWRTLSMDAWRRPRSQIPQNASSDTELEAIIEDEAQADPLQYELSLEPGEIRQQPTAGGVIVRMGRQSIRSYLAGNVFPFLIFGVYLFFLGRLIFSIWLVHLTAPSFPILRIMLGGQLKWMFVIFALIGLQLFRLFRGWAYCGGTAVLVASPGGLHFRNAPARPREGMISRHDIRGLLVVMKMTDGFQKRYQLTAIHRSGRQVLLSGGDRDALKQTIPSLTQAMGIATQSTQS